VYAGNQMLTSHFRCTAPAKDLDSAQHVRRSQAHTELLVEEFELGMLWDEYGLVGDVVVRILLNFFCVRISDCYLFSHSQTVSLEPILMSFYHPTYYINLSKGLSRTILLRG
jgi:hypothetical protein